MHARASTRESPSVAAARGAATLMALLASGVLVRHAVRLVMVVRLVRSGVLATWPWRVAWPWVAGVSGLVLLVGLPWLLAFVRGAAWARREARGLGTVYLLWSLVERLFWAPTPPTLGQMLFAAGLTATAIGLWLALARLLTPEHSSTFPAAQRSKEAS